MSQGIDLVNVGLDYYFQHQRNNLGKRRTKIVRTISRTTLGRCIYFDTGDDYTDDQISVWLQEYRYAQKDKTMLYRIAARGYGRSARWYVLAGPKLDNLDGEGVVMAHAEWIISDAAARVVKDVLHEILPATDRYSGIQDRIDATVKKINHALDGMLADVRADKKWWEKMNKRTLDVIATLTADQEALIADLLTDADSNGDGDE